MAVLLISEKKIKGSGLIPDNLDATYLHTPILTCQDLYLQQAIGTKLYKKLCALVSNNAVEGAYKTLLDDYVQPYLLHVVLSEIQIPLFAKFRNAGMVQSQDTQTSQLSRGDVELIRANYQKQANFYQTLLNNYLRANRSQFPEYCSTDTCADIKATDRKTKVGIFLG